MKYNVKRVELTAKEKALRDALPRAVKPKKAATLLLWQGERDNPRILMGQRAGRHDFMPDVYVFPGGRVDRGDSYVPYTGDLSPRTETVLEAANSPRQARAIVLAAVRETWEETGLMLGRSTKMSRNPRHESWQAFYDAGLTPDLNGIEVMGRATTPPRRHKRFDTWFFARECQDVNLDAVSDSRELLNVGWFTFDQIDNLPLHTATETMLRVMRDFLSQSRPPARVTYIRKQGKAFISDPFPNDSPLD
ncbi:NUDIX domain-containing protein [Fretibacter rubidus]|uniref:NUDIX hydrolase n=1 Tax=Fretibacter rubidus TaxID=570162 RepID=UPI00352BC135